MVEASVAGWVEIVTTSKMRSNRSSSSTQQAKMISPPIAVKAFLKRYVFRRPRAKLPFPFCESWSVSYFQLDTASCASCGLAPRFMQGSSAGTYKADMINANHAHRPIRKFMRGSAALAAALLCAAPALAAEADDDDEAPEAISALGLERGLELYDRDAADPCFADRLQIRVLVTGVTEGGIMKLELFGEKDFFKKSGKLRKVRVPADPEPMLICMDVAAPGEYAVVGYHDRDGDRKLDKKWNFTPKEPYGLSNNPKIESLRLPKWEETRFTVPMGGTNIAINLVDLG